ncbi:MAG: glycosyltransferase [Candidatus Kapabacteria bacterium]|nr:glycosyltransferase [Candidatus Kapabacteria bacterium]
MFKNKSSLSVCIIAKNEENNLRDCLESVRTIAEEIILVDTGSTDSTIEIAREYGAKIIESPWCDDFSYSRNISIENASCKYILIIDADERLINPDLLIEAITNSKQEIGAWLIEVCSEARRADGGTDKFKTSLLRLFINHPEVRFSGIIHEQIIEPLISIGKKIENTQIQFFHLGYSLTIEQMRKKNERNLHLLQKALLKQPANAHNLYHLSKTYLALGDLKNAAINIEKSIKFANTNSAIYPQSLNYGAIIAFQMKDYKLALERSAKSLEIVNNQMFANFIIGETMSTLGRFQDALDAYLRLDFARQNPDTMAQIIGDYYLPQEQYHYRVGRSYIGLKDYKKARIEFTSGNLINPNDTSCLVGLGNVAFSENDYKKARFYLNQALAISPNQSDLLSFMKQVDDIENANKLLVQHRNDQELTNIDFKIQDSSNDFNASNSYKDELFPFITLAMIVKNEEKFLDGCLESVKGIVDEIIIVDTGSTDTTKEIAQKHAAKIFDFEWIGDFAAARNESLKHCTGKWILYLDADERLDRLYSKDLKYILANLPEEIGGIICTIESDHLQLTGSVENHRGGYPRIFRNYGYPKIQFRGRVHEQITPSIFELGKTVPLSDVVITHLGYNQSREIMESKIKRNYQMLLAHVNEEPLNGYAWYQLGQTLAQMSIIKEAEEAIRFAIKVGSLSCSVYASAAATLSQITGNQKKFSEALEWADKSLSSAPNQVYALNLKAYSLLYLDRNEEAVTIFEEVLKRSRAAQGVPHSGFDIRIPEEIILNGINEAKKKLGLN